MKKNIVIAGASGMIGSHLMDLCLKSDEVNTITSLVRKPSETKSPKIREVVVRNFETIQTEPIDFGHVDIVFFCIGVYTGAVPADEFRKITVNYPINLAKSVQKTNPNVVFCLLSGAGADRSEKSRMMFARDKGAAENQLSAMKFSRFHTFRPSYIYPDIPRKEPNLSYRLMKAFYPLMRLFGDTVSIRSMQLATVMFEIALNGSDIEVWENKDMIDYLNRRIDS